MHRRRRDLLEIIESAYRLDPSDAEWRAGLGEALFANVPFRVMAVTVSSYDVSDPERPRLTEGLSLVSPNDADIVQRWGEIAKYFETDTARTRASYGTLDEGLALDIPVPGRERLDALFRRLEVGEIYGINARNPSGKGVLIGIWLPPRFAPLTAGARRSFGRIARHVAAAHRLRQRLATVPDDGEVAARGEAVLSPSGVIEDAVGDAREDRALDALRRSVEAVAMARGRRRHEDPEKAIASWKALVDARWSLVDHFERGGRHYLVAHRNDFQLPPISLLTDREQQVVALAAMGQSNKAIAYDLGISTSTVGVLMSRALERLGLRTRRELQRVYGQLRPPREP